MTLCSLEPRTIPPSARPLGVAAAWISVLAAVLIIHGCLQLAFEFAGYAANSSCGTSAERVAGTLAGVVPLWLAVPLAAWATAHRAGAGILVARCASLSAVATWLTVRWFIESWHWLYA